MRETPKAISRPSHSAQQESLVASFEWLAHYNYLHAAQIATGLNAPQVSGMLKTRANDELGHALLIGERILELGGALPGDWSEVPNVQRIAQEDASQRYGDPGIGGDAARR